MEVEGTQKYWLLVLNEIIFFRKLIQSSSKWIQNLSIRFFSFVVRCTIWCHLYNLKNVKNTHAGVLILVKLLAEACTT